MKKTQEDSLNEKIKTKKPKKSIIFTLLIVVGLIITISLIIGLTKESAPESRAQIIIDDYGFNPKVITVEKGTIITWINSNNIPHKIITNSHPEHDQLPDLESGDLSTTETYEFTFNKVGVFEYHDENNIELTGTVIVK
jgi:plastocyanin